MNNRDTGFRDPKKRLEDIERDYSSFNPYESPASEEISGEKYDGGYVVEFLKGFFAELTPGIHTYNRRDHFRRNKASFGEKLMGYSASAVADLSAVVVDYLLIRGIINIFEGVSEIVQNM